MDEVVAPLANRLSRQTLVLTLAGFSKMLFECCDLNMHVSVETFIKV